MPLLLTVLLRTVIELLQYSFQLCGNRQAEMGCVLHEGYSFIGQVKENDSGAKYTRRAEDKLFL